MTILDQCHEELALSLAQSIQKMSIEDIHARALSNPELVQEWVDELQEEYGELQIQAARLKQQIDRLQPHQKISLLKVA